MDRGLTPLTIACPACGGVYAPIQRDGSVYAHVCPPAREPDEPATAAADPPAAVLPANERARPAVQRPRKARAKDTPA